MLLLEGPERALGLACIDLQVVAGVVEHLTTGRVVPSANEPRGATRTDAMMLSELLDGILAVFDGELAQMPDAPPAAGFHHLVVLEDARAVMMALEDIPYRQFQLALDLGGGAKSGEITFYFPFNPPRKTNYRTREFNDWHDKWRSHVLDLPAPIEAIIHRVPLSVTEVAALEVGSLIPVPLSKIASVSLEGADGDSVATGKLGQAAGFRAIRISTDVRPPDATIVDAAAEKLNVMPDANLPPSDMQQDTLSLATAQNDHLAAEPTTDPMPTDSLDAPQTV
jgi:flagellar motor switch protein FliM